MPKFCSKCGARALPGARFCRSCGARLPKQEASTNQAAVRDSPEAAVPEELPTRVEEEPVPVQVELTEEEEQSLLLLAEIIPHQKKIEDLKKEKDALEIQFRVEEEISEKEYNKEKKDINEKISELEKDIKEKRKVMSSLSLLNLVQEVVEMRERQVKLEEIFKEGRIQESTYDRLKREYKEKEKITKAKADEEEAKLKQYRRNLKDEKEKITSMKEELWARYEVGEFSEEEYKQKLQELESRNIEGLIAAVDEIIERMIQV
ncbi:MAG: zinc-ribbon domain-containing protein [Candidatus Heimdallarchaeota archaeon]|nr:zinc-ribbon domain-containing protein [Candidatus Heimdallarchaeota archaeon]